MARAGCSLNVKPERYLVMINVTAENEYLYCWGCRKEKAGCPHKHNRGTSLIYLRIIHKKYGDKDFALLCVNGKVLWEEIENENY